MKNIKRYEFTLSNNYEFYLDTDLTYEQLKNYVASNTYITLYSSGSRPYGNGGWERVPKQVDIKTNNIVWFEEDEGFHENMRLNRERNEIKKKLIEELGSYKINWWNKVFNIGSWIVLDAVKLKNGVDEYSVVYYQKLLEYCKKKKFTKKEQL